MNRTILHVAVSGMSAPGTSATFQSFGDPIVLGKDGGVMLRPG